MINETSDFAYGAFKGNELIGYCSIGYADGFEDVPAIVEHKLYNNGENVTLILSDVYIKKSERNNGYASKLVSDAISMKLENDPDVRGIFALLLDDNLMEFYEKLGFEWADDSEEYCIVKPVRKTAAA
ncbi:MAG: GNAT family N-acetyltransferase [Lachnospiraceae bacterium]|nr:GNAT family N-acetyltransferase [Lachnospiraceae bacterium]